MQDFPLPDPRWADLPVRARVADLGHLGHRDPARPGRGDRLHRLRLAGGARLGAARARRRGADRGGARRRPDGVLLFTPRLGWASHRSPRPADRGAPIDRSAYALGVAGRLGRGGAGTAIAGAQSGRGGCGAAAATELGNPVAAVLIAFRAVDTMLESVVLALAVIVLWSFGADRAWGERPAPWISARRVRHRAPALVLLGRLLPPVGLGGRRAPVLDRRRSSGWSVSGRCGAGGHGGADLAGAARRAAAGHRPTDPRRHRRRAAAVPAHRARRRRRRRCLSGYPEGFTKPLILLIEAAKTLSVAVALALLVAGPPELPRLVDEPPPNADRQRS
jgi:hypothetical protein